MKLDELEPQFMRYETRTEDCVREYTIPVDSFAEAQGIWFLCPKCFAINSGPVGTHMVDCTFAGRGALDTQGSHGKEGKPTRWNASGSDYSNLSLTPSILIDGGCAWHGHVTNGEIT